VTARQIGYSLERFILRKANVTRTHGRHSSREVQNALKSLAPDQLLRLSQHVEQNFTSRFRGSFNIFANIPSIANIGNHVRPTLGRPGIHDRSRNDNNGRSGLLGAFGRGANNNGFARGANGGQVAGNVPLAAPVAGNAPLAAPVAASGMYEEGDFAVDDFSDYALGEEDYVEGDFATDAGDDDFADFAVDDFSDEEGDFAFSEYDLALDEVDYALDGDFAIEEEEGTAAFDENSDDSAFAHAGEDFGDFAEGDLVDEPFEAVGEFATEEVDTFEAVGDFALDEYFALEDPSATQAATSDALPGWVIGLVVVGILVFIAMIVVAIQVVLYVRMK